MKTLVQEVKTRILTLLDRRNGTWEGTMTDLDRAITKGLRRSVPAEWPGSPSHLRRVVNRTLSSLRKEGVRVQFTRTSDHARNRLVSFVKRS